MVFSRSIILLPCQSLEDLSLKRDSIEANQLLAAWSMAWHPALLASTQCLPTWERAEAPPEDLNETLLLIPRCSYNLLPEGWLEKSRSTEGCLIEDCDDRGAMLAVALARLDPQTEGIDPEIAADFMALGVGHFLVEVLTRQLRYMSNLDASTLQNHAVAAANAAVGGDTDTARAELQAAFDVLHEAREYFYPVDAHLIDITLVAPGVVGESLRQELAGNTPLNLLITGEALEEMVQSEPETLLALQEALAAKRISIVGGEYGEAPFPLLSSEAIAWQLQQGRAVFSRCLGQAPSIFGRRRYGLMSLLPQLLRKAGFTAALHFTLDDGRFPTVNQSRIAWEGIDGTTIDVLTRVPLDARRHDTFFRLSERLGDVLDLDHSATLVFAHWPGETSPWYRDIQRIARHSRVLGTFITLDEYLPLTGAGQTVRHPTDDYRVPYLQQDVAAGRADPISRYVRYHLRRTSLEVQQTLAAFTALNSGVPADDPRRTELLAELENSLAVDSELPARFDQQLAAALGRQVQQLAAAVVQASRVPNDAAETPATQGCLWFNPFAVIVRVAPCGPSTEPVTNDPVQAATALPREVPPLGFAWMGAPASGEPMDLSTAAARKAKPEPPLAEGNILRNEYFNVTLSTTSGGIQSVTDYNVRGNRLGQQIVVRRPGGDSPDAWYQNSIDPAAGEVLMALDTMTVTSPGPSVGEIVCRGRLVDREGQLVAGYVQTVRVHRGNRVLELDVQLDPQWLPESDPWNSYYAVRFAWSGNSADVYRSAGLVHRKTELGQFEAPHFVDIRSGKARTTLLTGGLSYHRRHEQRMLDTLLIVAGETARTFRLGVGFDLPAPASSALEFLAPPTMLPSAAKPSPESDRWFQLDARHVVPTFWEPLVESDRVAGFRVRLLETEGKLVQCGLKCFRPLGNARKADVLDGAAAELTIEEGRVLIPLRPCEWALIECRWKEP
jgi:alpha-mannosidase